MKLKVAVADFEGSVTQRSAYYAEEKDKHGGNIAFLGGLLRYYLYFGGNYSVGFGLRYITGSEDGKSESTSGGTTTVSDREYGGSATTYLVSFGYQM